ncbi:MAG TPA: ATP synthase F1 subunit delta [Anaeromyxobacteraceae bacterium]
MIVGSIARRYAKALFDLAVEQGKLEAWSESLLSLKQAVESSDELRDVLVNPIYAKEQRRAIAGKLVAALRLDADPANLLYLLGDRNRLVYLGAIADRFRELADAKLGLLRAQVTSAVPLDGAAAQSIADKLARATGSKVILNRAVDEGLLGGVVAEVGNLTYDGSVRTQLEDLRKTLKQ